MIEEIKKSLNSAEVGPWKVEKNEVWGTKEDRDGFVMQICKVVPSRMGTHHLQLISNTPTYIRYLLGELDKANKEIERLKELAK